MGLSYSAAWVHTSATKNTHKQAEYESGRARGAFSPQGSETAPAAHLKLAMLL